MSTSAAARRLNALELCPGCHLLQVPERGVSWLFNAWPDATKLVIQRGLAITGLVYPDLRFQGDRAVSCNLVEFPLLHALFNQGMLARHQRPQLLGTARQLALAAESFRRGMFGVYGADEMADCDLDAATCRELLREIDGLSPVGGIQSAAALLDLVELQPLGECPGPETATEVDGVRIWKSALNVFTVQFGDERVVVDCNLPPGQTYRPPLELDVKQFTYKLFQIVDTGEEDGFSPKSCMHTLIQWRDRIICIDLPMNVSYLLDRVSVSRSEIDAVIFTHNHDDHIGELSMLLQMDTRVTVICPRIVWRTILLKASAMLDMAVDELAGYFDYVPICYGEEYDYAGLRILAHPSIHSVPCAVYRIRGIVGTEWKSYGHMSDILNFQRCEALVAQGVISRARYQRYREFVLQPTTVKKIDVGATDTTRESSVHGYWRDFETDASEHIVLGHIQRERLDDRATVTVGQVAVAGSARDVGTQAVDAFRDKYRERALAYLADYVFSLVDSRLAAGLVERQQVLSNVRILADSEIRVIQPNTPFLKMGGESTFVDLVIAGSGSVWMPRGDEWVRVANVNAGDVIGDIGVLLQVPRTASIRSDTYMRVLRIPGFLFREVAMLLGVYSESGTEESVLQRTWRLRELLQCSRLLSVEVPIYLQNRLAQHAHEVSLAAGERVDLRPVAGLLVGCDPAHFALSTGGTAWPAAAVGEPVFGEQGFLRGQPERYELTALRATAALRMSRDGFAWMLDVPLFRLRLTQLGERRALAMGGAQRSLPA